MDNIDSEQKSAKSLSILEYDEEYELYLNKIGAIYVQKKIEG